jgi:hypothetical protein
VVEFLRSWSPAEEPLIARVRAALARAAPCDPHTDSQRLVAEVHAGVPADLRNQVPQLTPDRPPAPLGVQRRFLAAHAFASWTPHLALDLRAWVRSLDAARALLSAGHSVGEADLLLRHLADPHELARIWTEATSRP